MGKPKAVREAAAAPANLLDVDQLVEDIQKKQSFKGTQQNLYSYARMGWGFYGGQLVAFGLYSPAYTAKTDTVAVQFITDTEALPSYEALRGRYVVARKELENITASLLNGWQMLKGYCKVAYEAEGSLPTMLVAAGANYYGAAANLSWDAVATLIRMAQTFMIDNFDTLLANNNMPATFPASFKALGEAFTAQRLLFKAKEVEARTSIQQKFEANEKIYADLATMTDAGKVIFRTQPNVRHNFIINNLYKQVRGNSSSGVKGDVLTDKSPAMPVEKAFIYDKDNPERSATTGTDGKYELNLPAGSYTLVIEAEGYVAQAIQKKITIGTKSRLNFKLESVSLLVQQEVVVNPIVVPSNGESKLLSEAIKQIGNGVEVAV